MLTNHERQKLVEAVLYFATNVKKLGKVKLFKLLYFLDFEHFRDTGRSVTGMDSSRIRSFQTGSTSIGPAATPSTRSWLGKA